MRYIVKNSLPIVMIYYVYRSEVITARQLCSARFASALFSYFDMLSLMVVQGSPSCAPPP